MSESTAAALDPSPGSTLNGGSNINATNVSSSSHDDSGSRGSRSSSSGMILAGTMHVFVSGAGFMHGSDAAVRGTVDLTNALLEQGYRIDMPISQGEDCTNGARASGLAERRVDGMQRLPEMCW